MKLKKIGRSFFTSENKVNKMEAKKIYLAAIDSGLGGLAGWAVGSALKGLYVLAGLTANLPVNSAPIVLAFGGAMIAIRPLLE